MEARKLTKTELRHQILLQRLVIIIKFSRLGEPLQQLRIQKKNTKSLIALLLFKIIIYYENILPLRKRSTNDWMLVSIRQSKIV